MRFCVRCICLSRISGGLVFVAARWPRLQSTKSANLLLEHFDWVMLLLGTMGYVFLLRIWGGLVFAAAHWPSGRKAQGWADLLLGQGLRCVCPCFSRHASRPHLPALRIAVKSAAQLH
ncbi:uncharacterized protein K444DRAFT_32425 [Hyaloscypha bicolor E]|uniref:Uncharacterized protein n=1 Tax=Hyaloscypha bicolor E TaxID=1095630 RepID=A0A2J6T3T4_9HELO|nr:uncharacterized protein K444DRAFT_32425 [Hyaloscypha bicolor E]PMD57685.1 hypothetical protein K444DRAFT_32425 [Hyaloscypha bicolor E]